MVGKRFRGVGGNVIRGRIPNLIKSLVAEPLGGNRTCALIRPTTRKVAIRSKCANVALENLDAVKVSRIITRHDIVASEDLTKAQSKGAE